MKIGIFSRVDREDALDHVESIVDYLVENKIEIEIDTSITEIRKKLKKYATPLKNMTSDIVICLGGDGTVLQAQQTLAPMKIPVLSINMGTVGFLTELEPDETFECLDKLLNYDFFIEERMQLDVYSNNERRTVLNELVLMTEQASKMLDLKISVDEELVDEVRADGLIVSTPSGSTAYSMSAGGPIVDPRVDAAIIIPICPFKLNTRPKIVPADSHIKVKFIKEGKKAVAVLDGVKMDVLDYLDEVELRKSDNPAYFVRFKNNFYASVNSKLVVG